MKESFPSNNPISQNKAEHVQANSPKPEVKNKATQASKEFGEGLDRQTKIKLIQEEIDKRKKVQLDKQTRISMIQQEIDRRKEAAKSKIPEVKKNPEKKAKHERKKKQGREIMERIRRFAIKNAAMFVLGLSVLGVTAGTVIKANSSEPEKKKKQKIEFAQKQTKLDQEKKALKDTVETIEDKVNVDVLGDLETEDAKIRLASFAIVDSPEKVKAADLLSLTVRKFESGGNQFARNDANASSPASGAFQERFYDSVYFEGRKLDNDNEKDRQIFLSHAELQKERFAGRMRYFDNLYPGSYENRGKILRFCAWYFCNIQPGKDFDSTYHKPKGDIIPKNNNISINDYIDQAANYWDNLTQSTKKPGYWIFDDAQIEKTDGYGNVHEYGTLAWYAKDQQTGKYKPTVRIEEMESGSEGIDKDFIGPVGDDHQKMLAELTVKTFMQDTAGVAVTDTVIDDTVDAQQEVRQAQYSTMSDSEKALANTQAYAKQYRDRMTPEEYQKAMKGDLPAGFTPTEKNKTNQETVQRTKKARFLKNKNSNI